MIRWIFISRYILEDEGFKELAQQRICSDVLTKHFALLREFALYATYEYFDTFHIIVAKRLVFTILKTLFIPYILSVVSRSSASGLMCMHAYVCTRT